MRRGIALVFIVLIGLVMVAKVAEAEQVEHLGFEGFSLTQNSVEKSAENTGATWVKIASIVVSFPEKKYLAGVTADWEGSAYDGGNNVGVGSYYVKLRIDVNGKTVGEASHTVDWNHEKHFLDAFNASEYGDTFTIDIYVQAYGGDSDDTTRAEVHNIYIYSIEDNVSIRSKLTELKYIPPGAEDTSSALILNQTEVLLKQVHNLSEGTMAFWLKWDGTKNLTLSDNVGIDGNGYIYIKSDDGTTYTLEGVNPPVGQYVPVYIGWRAGEGYILMNTTKIMLNWGGNLIISKIGDINNESVTLIDEFKLWNTYIPPDQVIYESKRSQYTLLYNNRTINIKPEGGQSLGTIDVVFLDASYNTINSTTLSPGSRTAEVPANASMVVLTRGSVSRTFLLDNYSTIAFPAEGTTITVAKIQVTPEPWEVMEVRTVEGAVATKEWLNNGIGHFTAVYGNQYLFVFKRGNETVARLATIKGDTVFYILTTKDVVKPPIDFQVTYDPKEGILSAIYLDQNLTTQGLNITIEGYKDFTKVFEVSDSENSTLGYYKLTLSPNGTDYVQVTLYALRDGEWEKYEKTVPTGSGGRAPFPPNLVPPALIVLGSALIPLFLSKGTEPWLMLIGGAIGLTITALLGWIPLTSEVKMLITALTVLGVVTMLAYRR